ncbi:hypothetical protein [Chengkuizengella axinellae]|uniref:Na+/H+ antiporter MnhB subunit-related protein domain-containing protein n=1 Tax=Chengkuizengella axinellae TaxID=3064388 RepID=A0ABT9J3F4_9BACL|nr:hypothetical protein [Chengkuizengella sp. 2205SS18-9]MDP5276013.1 hypothetical protein [Chengkuizengella sp. 2205SS18-9]
MNSKIRKIAQLDAVLYFIVCLLSAYYIADHPPPPRFILIVLGLCIMTFVVYKYCLFIVRKMILNERHLLYKTIIHGALFGVVLGIIFSMFPNGEPSKEGVSTTWIDYLFLFVVTIAVNMIIAGSIYIFNRAVLKIWNRNN